MGKLLDLFRVRVPSQPTPLTRATGVLVELDIVGESHRQDYLRKLRQRYGDDEFDIVLKPEPTNQYDANAVAVLVDGSVVGYLARSTASQWQPVIMAAEADGLAVVGSARLFGGTSDKPSLGVFGEAPWPRGVAPAPKDRLWRPGGRR